MSREALAIGTDVKPPVLFKGEYEQWKDKFLDFIDRHDLGDEIKKSLKEGIMTPPTKVLTVAGENGQEEETEYKLPIGEYSEDQLKRHKGDKLAKSFILQGIPNEIYVKIDSYNATEFKAKAGESLEASYDRFVTLLNELSKNKISKSHVELNVKFLSNLQPEWKRFTRQMRQSKDLHDIPLHEVYEILRQNKEEVEEIKAEMKKADKAVADPVALVVKKSKKKKVIESDSEEADCEEKSETDDCEKLMETMLMLTKAFQKKFYKKPNSNSQRYSSGPNNYKHKEKVEERRSEEMKKDGAEENKKEEPIKCYNCEAGKALMAEDEYWLDHSDDESEEGEKDETAHLCLMGKNQSEPEADSDDGDNDEFKECEFKFREIAKRYLSTSKENKSLIEKVNALEEKLHSLGQTEHTIHLNKPKEKPDTWGLGYKNPHHLKKVISEVPALYDFGFMLLAPQHQELKPFWTSLSEKDKAKEYDKRKNTTKVQLPFRYEKLNNSYRSNKSKFLSNDYFESYFVKELEAKPNEDLRKQRVGVKTAWIPKQKIDEKAKSSSSFILNKKNSSKDDLSVNVATFKNNLVDSRKKYSIKQLFQLAPSSTKKFLNYGECDYASRRYSDTRHMWYLDSGCSKHMTMQKSMLSNYKDKYCDIVRFGNDQFSPILGYGDVVHENLTIKKVSYVEGLGHNLFSIGQFCDKDLEVNFKAKTCSIRTGEGKELLVGSRKSNLYTINLSKVQADNQVCLLSKASMQQSWLWHRRLSHLNFRYINKLVSGKLVKGLPELKYEKEHLCAACEK
ncbi:hypothetical protein L6452_25998 [Arctium lappa]|uniref:Uncharacterized protein n=1 Tax=Arctium lappa TaxID=4217 RepID=A0ACB9AB54_ARCLA|nr:hypothetical protein L6452_25998 [Arctium lappa]